MDKVLAEFGLIDKTKKKNVLTALYQPPKKDKGINMPRFSYPSAGQVCQADLLFMPNDKGFKYVLVVVDNGSRLVDAEPLKSKESVAVVTAFKKIFTRKNVTMPKRIEVDSGSEFKAATQKYFNDNNVTVRVAPVGRHRAQALVERVNQTIGAILHKRMVAQELLTGTTSRHWVKDLPQLVKALNAYITKREAKRKARLIKHPLPNEPLCSGDSCDLLNIGDKVRVALEFPIDPVSHEKLHGKFRSSDIRWHPTIRTVKHILLKPNMPPLYLLDGSVGSKLKIDPIAYTRNQLQIVHEKESLPPTTVVRGKPKQYIVEAIIGKKKISGKVYYRVKWLGYDDSKDQTYEPRSTLIQEVPELVKDFEKAKKG